MQPNMNLSVHEVLAVLGAKELEIIKLREHVARLEAEIAKHEKKCKRAKDAAQTAQGA